jgi:hypothetical protein
MKKRKIRFPSKTNIEETKFSERLFHVSIVNLAIKNGFSLLFLPLQIIVIANLKFPY